MKLEKILSVIFMSVFICCFAGFFGLVFNIFNPKGLSIMEKMEIKKVEAVKPVTPEVKSTEKITPVKKIPVKNPEIKVTVKPPVYVEVKKTVTPEIKPVTQEAAVDKKIRLDEAKRLFDSGKAVFVDARPEFVYVERHIKGAVSLSASRFEYQYEQIKDTLKKDVLYIVYCGSVTCHLSDFSAEKLIEKGFKNVKVFSDGWDEWHNAGYPIAGLRVKKEAVPGE